MNNFAMSEHTFAVLVVRTVAWAIRIKGAYLTDLNGQIIAVGVQQANGDKGLI
jgi:hypothetical protein